jgi:hypothetical protein
MIELFNHLSRMTVGKTAQTNFTSLAREKSDMVYGVALTSRCVLEYWYQMTALLIPKVFSQEDSESEPLLSPSCDK